MKLLKLIKSFLTPDLLIWLIIIVLLILGKNSTGKMQTDILITALFLFFVLNLIDAYADINKNEFRTYRFIILADIAKIVVFIIFCIMLIPIYNKTNKDIMYSTKVNFALIIYSLLELLRSHLKSDKYKNI